MRHDRLCWAVALKPFCSDVDNLILQVDAILREAEVDEKGWIVFLRRLALKTWQEIAQEGFLPGKHCFVTTVNVAKCCELSCDCRNYQSPFTLSWGRHFNGCPSRPFRLQGPGQAAL